MPELAEDERLVCIKACGICGSDLQQSDPLQAVIELTGGPGPIGRLEVKGGIWVRQPILAIFQVITHG
jgi:threonine dehydrogenase-like Zn-dependent dehydrogenase